MTLWDIWLFYKDLITWLNTFSPWPSPTPGTVPGSLPFGEYDTVSVPSGGSIDPVTSPAGPLRFPSVTLQTW